MSPLPIVGTVAALLAPLESDTRTIALAVAFLDPWALTWLFEPLASRREARWRRRQEAGVSED